MKKDKDYYKLLARLSASATWQNCLRPYLEEIKNNKENSKKRPATEFEAMSNDISRITINDIIDKIVYHVENSRDMVNKLSKN